MRRVYDNVKNTGLFDRECEKWRKKPQAEADEDRKENAPTATKATYTAHQVQEILQNIPLSFLETQWKLLCLFAMLQLVSSSIRCNPGSNSL